MNWYWSKKRRINKLRIRLAALSAEYQETMRVADIVRQVQPEILRQLCYSIAEVKAELEILEPSDSVTAGSR